MCNINLNMQTCTEWIRKKRQKINYKGRRRVGGSDEDKDETTDVRKI